jgi:hypothetical protein
MQLIIDCLYVLPAQPISNPLMWSRNNICWVQIVKLLIMYFFSRLLLLPPFQLEVHPSARGTPLSSRYTPQLEVHPSARGTPLSSRYTPQQLLPRHPQSVLLFENTSSFMTVRHLKLRSCRCLHKMGYFETYCMKYWMSGHDSTDVVWFMSVADIQMLSDLLLSDWYFAACCGICSKQVNKCSWHVDAMLCDLGEIFWRFSIG